MTSTFCFVDMVEVARKLLRKHGLDQSEPIRSEFEGIANAVFIAGDVVLRIGKDPEYESDAYTEWVAAPIARAADVTTPKLLVTDDDRSLVDAPVSIFHFVPGTVAERASLSDAFYPILAREIAHLHQSVTQVADPHGHLDDHQWNPVERLITAAQEAGSVDWLAWGERLARAFDHVPATVFVHGDMHLGNVIATTNGDFAAIIDWGDAGWGDPAFDLSYLPAPQLPKLLEHYLKHRTTDDPTMEGRIMAVLAYRAHRNARNGDANLLNELKQLLASLTDPKWQVWVPPSPLP